MCRWGLSSHLATQNLHESQCSLPPAPYPCPVPTQCPLHWELAFPSTLRVCPTFIHLLIDPPSPLGDKGPSSHFTDGNRETQRPELPVPSHLALGSPVQQWCVEQLLCARLYPPSRAQSLPSELWLLGDLDSDRRTHCGAPGPGTEQALSERLCDEHLNE